MTKNKYYDYAFSNPKYPVYARYNYSANVIYGDHAKWPRVIREYVNKAGSDVKNSTDNHWDDLTGCPVTYTIVNELGVECSTHYEKMPDVIFKDGDDGDLVWYCPQFVKDYKKMINNI